MNILFPARITIADQRGAGFLAGLKIEVWLLAALIVRPLDASLANRWPMPRPAIRQDGFPPRASEGCNRAAFRTVG